MENALVVHSTPQHTKGVSHHVAHRTRYRLPKGRRSKETAARIVEKVSKVPGVKSVDVNERTGSVLVSHEEHPEILEGLGGALDSIAGDLFEEVLEAEGGALIPGFSLLAHMIKKRAGSVDHFLADKTDNLIDLKMLVPVLFLGAGLIKVARSTNWIHEVPAWVLFYYAYDSYLKFHPPDVTATATVRPSGRSKNGATARLEVRKK